MIILFQDEPHRAYAFFGTEYYDAVNMRIRLVEEVRMGEERNAYDELFLYREVWLHVTPIKGRYKYDSDFHAEILSYQVVGKTSL